MAFRSASPTAGLAHAQMDHFMNVGWTCAMTIATFVFSFFALVFIFLFHFEPQCIPLGAIEFAAACAAASIQFVQLMQVWVRLPRVLRL